MKGALDEEIWTCQAHFSRNKWIANPNVVEIAHVHFVNVKKNLGLEVREKVLHGRSSWLAHLRGIPFQHFGSFCWKSARRSRISILEKGKVMKKDSGLLEEIIQIKI